MILIIDNYDSFTYNIVELIRQTTEERVVVIKSRDVDTRDLSVYDRIIFSPGPSLPNNYPCMGEILSKHDSNKSILGICLGHQAIAQYYGANLRACKTPFHGVKSEIICDPESTLFRTVRHTLVGRYHSWEVTDVPPELRVIAYDNFGTVMGIEHTSKRVFGVQFHPESYITDNGKIIIKNFLESV